MASAWGVGLATIAADGTTLDTFFRHLGLGCRSARQHANRNSVDD